MKKYYKVLGVGQASCHGGSCTWEPFEWQPIIKDIKPCECGYHLCLVDEERNDLISWLGQEIWEAEWRGKIIDHKDKVVVSEARITKKIDSWNDRTAQLFAADCAEHVLKIFEQKFPEDSRPRDAIIAARKFAEGKIGETELAAARDAAWAAARDAAWAAARDAAWAAARDAEKKWQSNLLMQYLNLPGGQLDG